jgi:hypothetical protein
MQQPSQREIATRAEARRRARQLARGETVFDTPEPEVSASDAARPQPRASFFDRLFPPAAPLPGRGDPLADFHYDGPLRQVVATGYLLTRNPLIWIAMGVAWAVTYYLQGVFQSSLIGIVASMLSFVALIAAGWVGWQRPWAYGLAAAIVGFLLFAIFVLLNFLSIPTSGDIFDGGRFAGFVVSYLVMQSIIGVIAGFYGGYLRRRLSESRPAKRNQRRR